MRLLVGEDNPGDARLIVEALRENPELTSVEVMSDGDQVLTYLRRVGASTQAQRPDLLLLDLHLPKTNGLDVIRAIRTTSELSSLPICVFTGSLSETERQELLALKVEHITHKPLDLGEYFAAVKALLVWWRQRQSREA